MTIAEAREKCKNLVAGVPRDVLIIGVLVLASSLSFGLGLLAGLDAGLLAQTGQGSEMALQEIPPTAPSPIDLTDSLQAGQVVASKNGTKYYLPGCAGADRISDANKVWFASPAAALAAGYTPAANCKGI